MKLQLLAFAVGAFSTEGASIEHSHPTTAALEKDVTDLLLGLSAGGLSATPFGDSVQEIVDLIEDMKKKVLAAHVQAQKDLDRLHEIACKCEKDNPKAEQYLKEHIEQFHGYLDTHSPAHKKCRGEEFDLWTAKEKCLKELEALKKIRDLKYAEFVEYAEVVGNQNKNHQIVKKAGSESIESYVERMSLTICGKPGGGGKGSFSWEEEKPGYGIDGFLDKLLRLEEAFIIADKKYKDKKIECDKRIAEWQAKIKECDAIQHEMDVSSCKGVMAKHEFCEEEERCHDDEEDVYLKEARNQDGYPGYNDVMPNGDCTKKVKGKEGMVCDRKAEWRGLMRIQCLIEAFKDEKVDNAEINACKAKSHPYDHLNLKYEHIDMIEHCDEPDSYPMTHHYYIREFLRLPKPGAPGRPGHYMCPLLPQPDTALVALKSHHGKFLTAEYDGRLNADREYLLEWEAFEMRAGFPGEKVTLKSYHGKWVTAEPDGRATANRPWERSWEKFKLIKNDDNTLSFLGAHKKYLVAEQNGDANFNREKLGPWEKFQLIVLNGDEDATPDDPIYYAGARGAEGCPKYGKILSHLECEKAHKDLGLKHSKVWTGALASIPGRCSTRQFPYGGNHDLHWNRNTFGAARQDLTPVCRQSSSYYTMPIGSEGCTEEERIKTKEECQQAHTALGLITNKHWTGSLKSIPGECSTRQYPYGGKHDLHWNKEVKGKARADLTPVCKSTEEVEARIGSSWSWRKVSTGGWCNTEVALKHHHDTGFLKETKTISLDACQQVCSETKYCEFASYKAEDGNCKAYRYCDSSNMAGAGEKDYALYDTWRKNLFGQLHAHHAPHEHSHHHTSATA